MRLIVCSCGTRFPAIPNQPCRQYCDSCQYARLVMRQISHDDSQREYAQQLDSWCGLSVREFIND